MEELLDIAEGPSLERWSPFDDALIGLADQLFRHASVTDDTWTALAEEYDVPQLMDAVVTVGQVVAVSTMLNAFGVQAANGDRVYRLPTSDVAYRVVVPEPDHLLARGKTPQHLLPDRSFLDLTDELLGDLEINIGLEQGAADLPHRFIDVLLGEAALPTELVEDGVDAL